MQILVTGADSFIGHYIASHMIAKGHTVRVMGTDSKTIASHFPNSPRYEYAALSDAMIEVDYVIHTQAQKYDASLDSSVFQATNVTLIQDVVTAAKTAGVARFVNVSSVHALNGAHDNAYIQSRKQGAAVVQTIANPQYRTVYLPPLYGDTGWDGRLAMLNSWPAPLARLVFPVFAALKPTVHVNRVVKELLANDLPPENQDWIITQGQDRNWAYKTLKRIIDLAFCATIVGLLFWALILIWIIIRCTSKGPALFVQDRVGQDGVVFKCWKFRTMHLNTPQTGTHNITQDATTKIGRILRSTKIDELPQVKNILMNEMSLIGPRPCLPSQTTLINLRLAQGGLSVKPGISGLAQVKNVDMSTPELLSNVDARYVKLQSLALDVKLIVATATGSGQGDLLKPKTP